MADEQYTNNPAGTLGAAIASSGVTSITMSSVSGYPTSDQFRIRIDNEIMIVTAGAGTTTWTVTRGAEGTTATTHSNGATVDHILTAGGLSGIRAQMNRVGVYSSLPGSPKAGDCYHATDGGYDCIFDGSSWRYFFGPFEVFPPGLAGSWSWVNQGSATLIDDGGYQIQNPGSGSHAVHMRSLGSLSFPFTLTMALAGSAGSPGWGTGLGIYDGSGLRSLLMLADGSGPYLQVAPFPSLTSSSGATTFANTAAKLLTWLRMICTNATNRTFQPSGDGQNWTTLMTESSSFTPTDVGFFFDMYAAGLSGVTQISDRVVSFKVT